MRTTVIWSEEAEVRLADIHDYLFERAGQTVANRVIRELIQHSLQLREFPESGVIEKYLIHRTREYRTLIHGNFKIIYTHIAEHEEVLVVDVFDTRQDPEKINKVK